jgi:NADH-quinone oxidoreductase subunit M
MTQSTLLTWMTFTPALGMLAIVLLYGFTRLQSGKQELYNNVFRVIAIAATVVPFILAIYLYANFNPNQVGDMQFVHRFVWLRSFNIEYFVGVDGISVSMVLLSALISLIAIFASMPWWSHVDDHHFSKRMVPGYLSMFLLLETGMMGVFVSVDFFLFYVFWELMLLPMYFLIGIWGGPRKEYAAIKFFLYTLAGSVLMLIALIGIYYMSDPSTFGDGTAIEHTFNLLALGKKNFAQVAGFTAFGVTLPFDKLMWVFLFIGFAIKIPMFPFHTWLPDAHVEAPTPISVILAGILLKMGTYGILRVNFTLFEEATRWAATAMAVFGTINIVYAAFVCMAQKDLKKLIAYSSVSHMGFVLLGMAAFNEPGINGAVLQMWNHGIISPMLFLIAGVIYDRAHHRNIEGFGGLAKIMPEYVGLTGLAFFASLGLPGLAGFISEALCFLGGFGAFRTLTILSVTSVIITAAYYLWTMQRMFLGQLNEKYAHYVKDGLAGVFWRERLTLYPLAILIVVMGFYPTPILDLIRPGLNDLVNNIKQSQSVAAAAATTPAGSAQPAGLIDPTKY